MCTLSELSLGQKLNEGKTKQIFELVDEPGLVLVQSKDQITAGNAARKDEMEGKAAISNKTTCCVFQLLHESGEDSGEVVTSIQTNTQRSGTGAMLTLKQQSTLCMNGNQCWVGVQKLQPIFGVLGQNLT